MSGEAHMKNASNDLGKAILTGAREENTPFVCALTVQSSGKNSDPPPDFVL